MQRVLSFTLWSTGSTTGMSLTGSVRTIVIDDIHKLCMFSIENQKLAYLAIKFIGVEVGVGYNGSLWISRPPYLRWLRGSDGRAQSPYGRQVFEQTQRDIGRRHCRYRIMIGHVH